MLFYNPTTTENPFPVFSEAIRFYHHHSSQVRTVVQATSLEIFAKLRAEEFWQEPYFQRLLAEFFTHVCCLLRDLWQMVDTNVRSRSRKEALAALRIQNDILMYVNDVFLCDIRPVSDIVQEKLLRFAVLPVLVQSILLRSEGCAAAGGEEFGLSTAVASYLLFDALTTLRNAPVAAAVASAILRREAPEQELWLIAAPPPHTPRRYLALQAEWGSPCEPTRVGENVVPDEALYQMPDTLLVVLLRSRKRHGTPTVRNCLLDSLEAELSSSGHSAAVGDEGGGSQAAASSSLFGVVAVLLRTLRSVREALDDDVAGRLGAVLCGALSAHDQLKWVALECALNALKELALLADSPTGRARQVLGPHLEAEVLQPLAVQLVKASGSSQERWLAEFEEQWAAHRSSPQELPGAAFLERELLDLAASGVASEPPGVPEGRARCLRVLLAARRLNLSLQGDGQSWNPDEKPELDDVEESEQARFQPGVSVYIGRVNRVKCVRALAAKGGGQEVLYLLLAQSLLVLVRPDEQKPFWAVPVIVEPLRAVKLLGLGQAIGSETPSGNKLVGGPLEQISAAPGANGDETQRALRMEVFSPCSPDLQRQLQLQLVAGDGASAFAPSPRGGLSPLPGAAPLHGLLDHMAVTVPSAPLLAGSVDDRIAHSMPSGGMPALGAGAAAGSASRSTPLVLLFADERRRRVACKIVVQARHGANQRMVSNLETFLQGVHDAK